MNIVEIPERLTQKKNKNSYLEVIEGLDDDL